MNNKIQTDHLPLKRNTLTDCFFVCVYRIVLFEKRVHFATFVFLFIFRLKYQYLKCSESVVSANKHALPKNIVLMYSEVLFNSKFKFSRKCQNKSVCVRRSALLRYTYKVRKSAKIGERYNQVPHLTQDTTWESNKNTINITIKSQEASPFPAGDHKAAVSRRESMRNTRLK